MVGALHWYHVPNDNAEDDEALSTAVLGMDTIKNEHFLLEACAADDLSKAVAK